MSSSTKSTTLTTTTESYIVYTAPESNTVLKRAPWYEKSGSSSLERPSYLNNPNAPNANDLTTSSSSASTLETEKRASRFALIPFASDIAKSQSALQQSYLFSFVAGAAGASYRLWNLKRKMSVEGSSAINAASKNSKMVKITSVVLGFMYGSSAGFLTSYLFLRRRETKRETSIKEAMGALYPNDRTRQQEEEEKEEH